MSLEAVAVRTVVGSIRKMFPRSESQFLSFPSSPLAYTLDSLDFLDTSSLQFERAQAFSELSELLNRVPVNGELFSATGSSLHLWDVYTQIINTGVLAVSTASPTLGRRYDIAFNKLFVAGDLEKPSPLYATYKSYRQQYLAANAILESAQPSPPQALKAAVDSILDDWELLGQKSVVEGFLTDIRQYQEADPRTLWRNFRDQWDPGNPLNWRTFGDFRFMPTLLLPSNVSTSQWVRIHLDRDDIISVLADQSDGASALWGDSVSDTDLLRISFDLLHVDVLRPWWPGTLLSSRYWDLPGQQTLLDAGDPPQGPLASMVTSVLLLKALSVTYKKEPSNKPNMSFLRPIPLEQFRSESTDRIVREIGTRARTEMVLSRETTIEFQLRGKLRGALPVFVRTAANPNVTAASRSIFPASRPGTIINLDAADLPLMTKGERDRLAGYASMLDIKSKINLEDLMKLKKPSLPPPSPQEWTEVTDPGIAYVGGLLCSRVSAPVPNPDRALDWG